MSRRHASTDQLAGKEPASWGRRRAAKTAKRAGADTAYSRWREDEIGRYGHVRSSGTAIRLPFATAVLVASALLIPVSCGGDDGNEVVTVDGVKISVRKKDGLLCLKEEPGFAADGRSESGGGGGCGDGPTKDNPVTWGVSRSTKGGAIGTAGAGVAVTSGLVLGATLPNVEQFDLTIGEPDPELKIGSETRTIRPTRGKKAGSVSVWRTTVETTNLTVLQKISVSNIRYSGTN